MGQFANLQVNQEVELQAAVIENQINVPILFLDADMLLPGDKGKTATQFQQKTLQMGDDGSLLVGLVKLCGIRQAEELQDIRIFQRINGRAARNR